jgi:hypothetical protein
MIPPTIFIPKFGWMEWVGECVDWWVGVKQLHSSVIKCLIATLFACYTLYLSHLKGCDKNVSKQLCHL